MPRNSKNTVEIAGRVTHVQNQFISARAEALGWKKPTFVTAIINYWIEQGCPPLSESEEALAAVGKLIGMKTHFLGGTDHPRAQERHG